MTDKNDDPLNADEGAWQEVFSGKRLPRPESPEEQAADQARQVLLWRKARRVQEHTDQHMITPQQAESYYRYIRKTKRARYPLSYLKGVWWLLLALILLVLGISIGYYLTQKQSGDVLGFVTPGSAKAQKTYTPRPPSLDYPDMVEIPGGHFTMGCTPGWDDALGGCRDNEYPAHAVAIAPFYLGRHEVTVEQFKRFVDETAYQTLAEQHGCTIADPGGENGWIISPSNNWRHPGFPQTDAHPVVCISWQDTQAYLAWLSQKLGRSYRLPTEEEWEYAARAGRITAFFWGNVPKRHFANYAGKKLPDQWEYTAPVGQFSSNAFGLHDMAGNTWEWTRSCWTENYQNKLPNAACVSGTENLRVRRGGGWDTQAPSIRSAHRSYGSEVERSYVYGFRVAHD